MARRMVYSATATSHQHSGSHDCFCHQSFFIHNLQNSEKGKLKTGRNAPPGPPPTIPVSRLALQWFLSLILYQLFLCSPLRNRSHQANPASSSCLPWPGALGLPSPGRNPSTSHQQRNNSVPAGVKCFTKRSDLSPKITNFTLNTFIYIAEFM